MATNFSVTIGEIVLFTFFVAILFRNGLQYRSYDFVRFICNDLATSCKNWVNFGPVNPEFKTVKHVHPSSISSLATRRHC